MAIKKPLHISDNFAPRLKPEIRLRTEFELVKYLKYPCATNGAHTHNS